jgi:DNA-directed RNA polymerase specialized sigma24 family protein
MDAPELEESLLSAELRNHLLDAINGLSDDQRAVISLRRDA